MAKKFDKWDRDVKVHVYCPTDENHEQFRASVLVTTAEMWIVDSNGKYIEAVSGEAEQISIDYPDARNDDWTCTTCGVKAEKYYSKGNTTYLP